MKRTIFLFLGFLLLSGAYSPSTSQAINLVQNGGFETGFTGWDQLGNTSGSTIIPFNSFPFDVHSGDYSAGLGARDYEGFLAQDLVTTPGRWYSVSFWLQNGFTGSSTSNPINLFESFFGTSTLLTLISTPDFDYTKYSFVVQATSSSTTLAVGYRNDTSMFLLDDVNVSPVPIPGAVWLFGSGLAGLIGIGRKRLK